MSLDHLAGVSHYRVIVSLSHYRLSFSLSNYRSSFGMVLSYRYRTITPKLSIRYPTLILAHIESDMALASRAMLRTVRGGCPLIRRAIVITTHDEPKSHVFSHDYTPCLVLIALFLCTKKTFSSSLSRENLYRTLLRNTMLRVNKNASATR